MGMRGRGLRVGQDALTDYNGPGPMARVTIVEADYTRRNGHSQSGTLFRVRPALKNGTEQSWYDADWFEPAPPLPTTADIFETPNVKWTA